MKYYVDIDTNYKYSVSKKSEDQNSTEKFSVISKRVNYVFKIE